MYKKFKDYASIKLNEQLLKTEAAHAEYMRPSSAAFGRILEGICAEIRRRQDGGALPALSYLEFTMLRANFMDRRYVVEAFAYGEKHYLDKGKRIVGAFDISPLFAFFDEMRDELHDCLRRFGPQLPLSDVKSFLSSSIPSFFSYFKHMARIFLESEDARRHLEGIKKADVFIINAGGYMAGTETVHLENKLKDAASLDERISKLDEGACISGDFSGLDLSGASFNKLSLNNANFSGSTLRGASFAGSVIEESNFSGADMEGCKFDNCRIFETSFKGANLKNASFVNAVSKTGTLSGGQWSHAGFLPVSFENAELAGADFTGAKLNGCIFSGGSNAPLTLEQQEKVTVLDEQGQPQCNDSAWLAEENAPAGQPPSFYFLMEEPEKIWNLPLGEGKEAAEVKSLEALQRADYVIQSNHDRLVSGSLKQLIEAYYPKIACKPVFYKDSAGGGMAAYWNIEPPAVDGSHFTFGSNGAVSGISSNDFDAPHIFCVASEKGARSIVAHLALVESMLRRGIQGVKLTRLPSPG